MTDFAPKETVNRNNDRIKVIVGFHLHTADIIGGNDAVHT